jgi:hypothetical protein
MRAAADELAAGIGGFRGHRDEPARFPMRVPGSDISVSGRLKIDLARLVGAVLVPSGIEVRGRV